MNITNLKNIGLAVALLASVSVASAADGKEGTKSPSPEGTTTIIAASQAQGQQQAADVQAKAGLTREQVLQDLKQYQREHANPSYAELVFLR